MNYYYSDKSGQPIGPYTAEELQRLRQEGTLDGNSQVSPAVGEGKPEWQSYATVFPSEADEHAPQEQRSENSPPETTREARKLAFISHSSKDHECAERICRILEGFGVNCWMAPRDVDPGAPYDEEIVRGIRTTRAFLLLLSEASNKSKHVKRELLTADEAKSDIYPIRIQDVQPGTQLQYVLQGKQWIDVWKLPIEPPLERVAQCIKTSGPKDDPLPQRKNRWLPAVTAASLLVVVCAVAVYCLLPSPKRQYAARMVMAERAVSNQLWEVATNCYAEAIDKGRTIESFNYSEAQIGLDRARRELAKEKDAEQKHIACQQLVADARVAESSTDWKKAITLYENALKLANSQEAQDGVSRTKEALATVCRGIRDKAKSAEANRQWKEAGKLYGNLLALDDQAKEDLDRLSRAVTDEQDALVAKAERAVSEGRFQDGKNAGEEALALADDPKANEVLARAKDGLTKQDEFERLMAKAAKEQTNANLSAAQEDYRSAMKVAPMEGMRAQAQDKADQLYKLMKSTFDALDRKARDAEGKGNLKEALEILEQVVAPDEPLAAQVQTRMADLRYRIAHPPVPVGQTVTLSWSEDPKAERHYPASKQVLDKATNVIGEVSIVGSDREHSGYGDYNSVTLCFKRIADDTNTCVCVFRKDDIADQTRIAHISDLFFLGRVVDISRKREIFGGTIESLTMEVTVSSDPVRQNQVPCPSTSKTGKIVGPASTYGEYMRQGFEAERRKDVDGAKASYIKALAAAPNTNMAAQARASLSRVLARDERPAQQKQPINQTETIGVFSGSCPDSARITNIAGKTVGTVRIRRESDFVGGVTITFEREGKQTTTICDFTSGDPVGTASVTKVDGWTLSVRISHGKAPHRANLRERIEVTVAARY